METEEKNTLDDIMGKKPELEVGKNYKIDLYPFGRAIRSGYIVTLHPSGQTAGSGEIIKAKYLGRVDKEAGFIENVFVFEDENKEINYAFFNDHWTREIKGIITYPCISSSETECFTRRYFKEELPKRLAENDPSTRHIWESESKLLEILKQLGEQI